MLRPDYDITTSPSSLSIAIKNIRLYLENYIKNFSLNSLVIGISGGVDSALCAALARPVCDSLDIPLIGRSLMIDPANLEERSRSLAIGKNFCHDFDERNHSLLYHNLFAEIISYEKSRSTNDIEHLNIVGGNAKTRIRMIHLYAVASMNNGMVLSTKNYTDFLLGLWTLHGDVGDFAMIKSVWKTEVYAMAEYLAAHELSRDKEKSSALRACVESDATDSLGAFQTDLDQIMPDWRERHKNTMSGYFEVDQVLKAVMEKKTIEILDRQKPILDQTKKTSYKHHNPYCVPRDYIFRRKK